MWSSHVEARTALSTASVLKTQANKSLATRPLSPSFTFSHNHAVNSAKSHPGKKRVEWNASAIFTKSLSSTTVNRPVAGSNVTISGTDSPPTVLETMTTNKNHVQTDKQPPSDALQPLATTTHQNLYRSSSMLSSCSRSARGRPLHVPISKSMM